MRRDFVSKASHGLYDRQAAQGQWPSQAKRKKRSGPVFLRADRTKDGLVMMAKQAESNLSADLAIAVQTKNKKAKRDMARPSVLIKLEQSNFGDEFARLFHEHVEGFTGLRGTKRERSEREKNMEWRIRLQKKRRADAAASSSHKTGGQKKRELAIENYRKLKEAKRREKHEARHQKQSC